MSHPRDLPSVSDLLNEPWAKAYVESDGHTLVTASLRTILDGERSKILSGENWQAPDWQQKLDASLGNIHLASTQRSVNATGILLHTGLGRAPMPQKAIDALTQHLQGSTQTEIDPFTGKRGVRDAAVVDKLCRLFGAEAGLVVNNNAAATLLVLHALCAGREVVISRGELVEIGGSFRMPEIMVQSQCTLNEIGSTNKTHMKDFEQAVNEKTGLIMQAHTSNYKIVGFSKTVPIEDLVALGKKTGVPVVHDIGSGALLDMTQFGLPHEPLATHSLKAGCELVFFSGDKMFGGPQSGIILGKKKFVDMCRNNPLARALRVGKMTLLALEATCQLYLEDRITEIPLYSRLSKSQEALKQEAQTLAALATGRLQADIEDNPGEMGSGSMPTHPIPSYRVTLSCEGMSAEDLSAHMRRQSIPIFGTLHEGKYGLNVLSLQADDHKVLEKAIKELAL